MGNKGSQPSSQSPSPQQSNTLPKAQEDYNKDSTDRMKRIQSSIDSQTNIIQTTLQTTMPNIINTIQSQNLEIQKAFQKANIEAMNTMSDNIIKNVSEGDQRIVDTMTLQNTQLQNTQETKSDIKSDLESISQLHSSNSNGNNSNHSKDIYKFLFELWNQREINIVVNLYREMETKPNGYERDNIYSNIMSYCSMKENKLFKYIEDNSSIL